MVDGCHRGSLPRTELCSDCGNRKKMVLIISPSKGLHADRVRNRKFSLTAYITHKMLTDEKFQVLSSLTKRSAFRNGEEISERCMLGVCTSGEVASPGYGRSLMGPPRNKSTYLPEYSISRDVGHFNTYATIPISVMFISARLPCLHAPSVISSPSPTPTSSRSNAWHFGG